MQLEFNQAIKRGDLNEVIKLSRADGVDVTADNNYAVKWAGAFGALAVVRYLIEQCQGVNVMATTNVNFGMACAFGSINVIRYLVEKCPGIDATRGNNFVVLSLNTWLRIFRELM